MLLESISWGDGGRGDSLGRNAFAYICWPHESFLKDTIMSCIRQRDDSYVQFYRYPGEGADTMSRDHVGAVILAFYLNRDRSELTWILENLPWRLSRQYRQTIDFWLWHRALYWNGWRRWIAVSLFYLMNIVTGTITITWNRIARWILGIKRVKPGDDPMHKPYKPKSWKWYVNKTIYPYYAYFLLCWQVRVLPDNVLKLILQRILLLESTNAVTSALLGRPVCLDDLEQYVPLSTFTWARRVDTGDDVMMRRLREEEVKYNDLPDGMLKYLYYKMDLVMNDFDDEIVQCVKSNVGIVKY